jgi:NADPH:quinone reductase
MHHVLVHAIRLHAFGPAGNLTYEEVPDPIPGAGQARIAVEAAGVHFVDTAIRRGAAGGAFPLPGLPMIPGREVAGVVDAVGPDADPGWVGRRVVAHLGMASGGYAELAVAAAAALHPVPGSLDAGAAVAAIGTGRTAVWLLDEAAPGDGDVVLVTAAAGGLGALLVQGALRAGAVVVGAAGGPEKVERVRALGAGVAVDYLRPDWPERARSGLDGRAVDLVLDGVGGAVGRAALGLLGVRGRLVLFGLASGEPTQVTTRDLIGRGLTATWAIGPRLLERPGGLRDLETRALAEAAAGRLVPLVGPPFPLREAAAAHAAIEARATVGKTVLSPAGA